MQYDYHEQCIIKSPWFALMDVDEKEDTRIHGKTSICPRSSLAFSLKLVRSGRSIFVSSGLSIKITRLLSPLPSDNTHVLTSQG